MKLDARKHTKTKKESANGADRILYQRISIKNAVLMNVMNVITHN
jgi:hypothetical protein